MQCLYGLIASVDEWRQLVTIERVNGGWHASKEEARKMAENQAMDGIHAHTPASLQPKGTGEMYVYKVKASEIPYEYDGCSVRFYVSGRWTDFGWRRDSWLTGGKGVRRRYS